MAKIQKIKLSSLNILSSITVKKEKIQGVTIDKKLTVSSHIKELCKKSSQKTSTFSKISNQLNDSEKNLFNAVVKSQLNYCPLVWMFCSRTSNNMTNKVYERIFLGDDWSNFESLLQTNKGICSHHKSIQSLMIEIFKIKNELALPIMDSVFERKNESYNLCNFQEFLSERKRTVHYGLESLSYRLSWDTSYRCPQVCSLLLENIKEVESLEIFKRKVKLSVTILHADYVNIICRILHSLIISAVIHNAPKLGRICR